MVNYCCQNCHIPFVKTRNKRNQSHRQDIFADVFLTSQKFVRYRVNVALLKFVEIAVLAENWS